MLLLNEVISVEKPRTPLWLWPNLLSLDAPLIALIWQDLLARVIAGQAPAMPTLSERAVLGLTVWAIYLYDRVLDVSRAPGLHEAARHRFYRRHKDSARTLFFLLVGVDIAIAVLGLPSEVFRNGLIVIAAVGLYLGIWHRWAQVRQAALGGWFAKEAVVAVLFTAGTFLVAWAESAAITQSLWPLAVSFGALCFLNLIAIEDWESGGTGIVAGAGAALLALWCWSMKDGSGWYEAIGLSAVCMTALAITARRFSLEARRALVDAVLLTPLALLASSLL